MDLTRLQYFVAVAEAGRSCCWKKKSGGVCWSAPAMVRCQRSRAWPCWRMRAASSIWPSVRRQSVRYNRKVSLRNVVAGQRVPIELTSLGRAWLAVATDAQRQELLAQFKARRAVGWGALEREINATIQSVRLQGYCVAAWQPEVVALAAPIVVKDHPIYVLNMSVTTQASMDAVANDLRLPLLDLAGRVREEIRNL